MPHIRFILLTIILLPQVVLSQQDEQYSHYMFNNMAFNPGYAGSKEEVSATLLQRIQWVGLTGAPKTQVLNIHSPFKLFNQNHGVGLNIVNGSIGYDKDFAISLAYAYRFTLNNNGKLGIGVSVGLKNQALNVTDQWKSSDGQTVTDEFIPSQNASGMTYDIGLGVYYKTDNVYFGLSTTHLTQSVVKFDKGEFTNMRHYYITGGYNFNLPNNPAFEFQPSFLITSDAISSKIDLNTIVQYNKKVWGGVTYRPGISITGMAGIELSNGIRIGYAYDFPLSDLRKSNPSQHEIILSYGFSIIKEKIPHKYRSIRFL